MYPNLCLLWWTWTHCALKDCRLKKGIIQHLYIIWFFKLLLLLLFRFKCCCLFVCCFVFVVVFVCLFVCLFCFLFLYFSHDVLITRLHYKLTILYYIEPSLCLSVFLCLCLSLYLCMRALSVFARARVCVLNTRPAYPHDDPSLINVWLPANVELEWYLDILNK